MKALPARLLFLLIGIALLLGVTHRQLLDYLSGHEVETAALESQPVIRIPEGGIRSDAFALRLFHSELAAGRGNVCVCPAAVVSLLRRLHELSGSSTHSRIDELHLPGLSGEYAPSAATLQLYTRLFADSALNISAEIPTEDVPRVPLSDDFSQAVNFINTQAENDTEGFAARMMAGYDISPQTRFIALSAARFTRPWLHPFHRLDFRLDNDFQNADGSVRPEKMMECSAPLCHATAEDGSWQALALFFRNEGREGAAACFVAILPARGVDARQFARSLTPEKLSAIRLALAKAAPTEMKVIMPAMKGQAGSTDLRPALQRLGLGELFSEGADFSRLSTSSPLQLDMVLARHQFSLEAEDSPAHLPDTGRTLRLNRPFIWFIGDLTTANPPCFIGLKEAS